LPTIVAQLDTAGNRAGRDRPWTSASRGRVRPRWTLGFRHDLRSSYADATGKGARPDWVTGKEMSKPAPTAFGDLIRVEGRVPMGSGRLPWKRDGAPCPSPGSDLSAVSQLDLIDVTLLTEWRGEPAEVPHLGLVFDGGGMTVRKRDGQSYVRIPWKSIVQLSADVVGSRHHELPTAVELNVTSERRAHRFLVPNVQPAALTDSLGAMSTRFGSGDQVIATPARHNHHRRS
jgi:hypothetical protein